MEGGTKGLSHHIKGDDTLGEGTVYNNGCLYKGCLPKNRFRSNLTLQSLMYQPLFMLINCRTESI